jgi:hypothetical protein
MGCVPAADTAAVDRSPDCTDRIQT